MCLRSQPPTYPLTRDMGHLKDTLERIESRIPEGPIRLLPPRPPNEDHELARRLNLYSSSILGESVTDIVRLLWMHARKLHMRLEFIWLTMKKFLMLRSVLWQCRCAHICVRRQFGTSALRMKWVGAFSDPPINCKLPESTVLQVCSLPRLSKFNQGLVCECQG